MVDCFHLVVGCVVFDESEHIGCLEVVDASTLPVETELNVFLFRLFEAGPVAEF